MNFLLVSEFIESLIKEIEKKCLMYNFIQKWGFNGYFKRILKIYINIHIFETNYYIVINIKKSLHDTYYIIFYFWINHIFYNIILVTLF